MIKKHSLFICLALLTVMTVTSGFAADNTSLPIEKTDHDSVHAKLLRMEKSGIHNADLYNQLGLSYFKQGRTGKAVICFLRALRLNSNHRDARSNLDFILNLSLDKELYNQPAFLSALFQNVFNFFNLNLLAAIVLILLLVTTLCVHWLLHLSADKDKAVPVMWLIIFSFILLMALTFLGLKLKGYYSNSKAVIVQAEAEGFSGPGREYGKLFSIHEGLIIQISRVDGDWALITLPNGGAGWIHVSVLKRVKP